MRPTIDHEGRLWFGEMGHNFLTVFDPHTQTFEQMIPPHGASGVMGVLMALLLVGDAVVSLQAATSRTSSRQDKQRGRRFIIDHSLVDRPRIPRHRPDVSSVR